ncbi:tyrosine-type recombinase/integrase [Stappia sp. F7233]|uniref:Tyrosine-type recombinase/integrase n=1 Tax=Stappia albiluteola TaxID=2758565 RepID=A0A839AIY8_9HYPH|nr:tyrosine-type recombinase/integrase [Stappia albiluteola]MBA5778727.1 tyrosine-type recombinase/integrase [Stappia albiluteola]
MSYYLKMKGNGRGKVFENTSARSINYAINIIGNNRIDQYKRDEILKYRDALTNRGLSNSSVRRVFASFRSIFRFVASENGLDTTPIFAGIFLGTAESVKKRKPIPDHGLKRVQTECRRVDDDIRHLIALVSDTGLRLAEAIGLVKDDVILDQAHPHLIVRPHPWRRLKTPSSERVVPLVGAALWAVTRAMETDGRFLFKRYCDEAACKASHASNSLNKWLSNHVADGAVMHSFRHSLRDRLRAVECPAEIVDEIGGWSSNNVGRSYGDGYPISVKASWMAKIAQIQF